MLLPDICGSLFITCLLGIIAYLLVQIAYFVYVCIYVEILLYAVLLSWGVIVYL